MWLAGCGGGSGTAGGTTIQDSERGAALQAITDHYEALSHATTDDDNAAMLAYLQSRPELTAVQQTDMGSIAARFTDGAGFVFLNNLDDGRDTGRGVVPFRDAHRAAEQVPEGGKAVLLNGMGFLPGGQGNPLNQSINQQRSATHIDRLESMFLLRGYQVTKDYATLARLRKLQDTDALYCIGHGGLGIDEKGKVIYVLNTADSVKLTPKDKALDDDIKANYVGYTIYVERDPNQVRRAKAAYYITPSFVRNYMRFNKYSLVFINGCAGAPASAGTPTSGRPNPQFHQAFFAAQASTYVGWDDLVNAGDVRDSAEYFFDRLLGASQSDVPKVKKDPAVRPFRLDQIWGEMRSVARSDQPFFFSQSLDSDPPKPGEPAHRLANLAVLVNPTDSSTFGLLAPGIQNLGINEGTSELTVFGDFGTSPGTVTLGGDALSVKTWTGTQIVCVLPKTGGGDVVAHVGGRSSNARRLSEWILPLTYKGVGTGEDGHTETANLVLRLRADSQSYRPSSKADPATINLSFVAFATSAGSTCQYSLTGQFSGQFPDSDNLVHVVTWEGAGSLAPRVDLSATPPSDNFFYNGHFDFNGRKLVLTFSGVAADKVTQTPGQPPAKSPWTFSASFFGSQQLTLTLDSEYAIVEGSLSGTWPANSFSSLPNMNLSLTWPTVSPTSGSEPDIHSARSVSTKGE